MIQSPCNRAARNAGVREAIRAKAGASRSSSAASKRHSSGRPAGLSIRFGGTVMAWRTPRTMSSDSAGGSPDAGSGVSTGSVSWRGLSTSGGGGAPKVISSATSRCPQVVADPSPAAAGTSRRRGRVGGLRAARPWVGCLWHRPDGFAVSRCGCRRRPRRYLPGGRWFGCAPAGGGREAQLGERQDRRRAQPGGGALRRGRLGRRRIGGRDPGGRFRGRASGRGLGSDLGGFDYSEQLAARVAGETLPAFGFGGPRRPASGAGDRLAPAHVPGSMTGRGPARKMAMG